MVVARVRGTSGSSFEWCAVAPEEHQCQCPVFRVAAAFNKTMELFPDMPTAFTWLPGVAAVLDGVGCRGVCEEESTSRERGSAWQGSAAVAGLSP
jgi:hypothetical protein